MLHFVDRYPGLTIAELLDILRITKQSLNRVLKDLIEQGYIAQKTGTSDRRQRLLYCTCSRGGPRRRPHAGPERRVARALAASERGGEAPLSAESFLFGMIEPDARAAVQRLMSRRTGKAA